MTMTDEMLDRLKAEGRGYVRMEIHHPDGTRIQDITASLSEADIGPHLRAQFLDPMVEALVECTRRKWLQPTAPDSEPGETLTETT